MKKIIKYISIIAILVFILLSIICGVYLYSIIYEVKDIDVNIDSIYKQSTSIYNDKDVEIYTSIESGLDDISILPQHTIDAFISIEDKQYYKHNGVNIKRIFGALINNIKNKDLVEGASTISQQYIKNKYLTKDKTIKRKLQEIYLTIKLENTNTKDQILKEYLDIIYFGHGAYGITNATKMYFDKDVSNLNILESATLASIIKSPATYSPILEYDNCISRRNTVLKEMVKDGKLSHTDYEILSMQPIELSITNIDNIHTAYIEETLQESSRILNKSKSEILNEGYHIYTYQNQEYQEVLDNVIEQNKNIDKNEYGYSSDKLSILQNNEGHILGMTSQSKYNIVGVKRQPGSTIKPILVYAPAIDKGLVHPITQILDEKIDYDGYTPHNVGNEYYGYISVRDSLSKSLNIPSIKILGYVGIDEAKKFATTAGIKFHPEDNGYAIALGGFTEGITLNSLINSYTPYINKGYYSDSTCIKCIANSKGKIVYRNTPLQKQIMGEDTASIMTDMLKYSVKNGTSKRLSTLDYDVAGKTGTVGLAGTNYNTDAYSIAYTSDIMMGVWFGNYTMDEKHNLSSDNNGGTYCTSIIKQVFDSIYKENKPIDFYTSPMIKNISIDKLSLIEDNVVLLADHIPDKYKIEDIFSTRYLPNTQSTRFSDIILPNIRSEVVKNTLHLTFDTLEYLEYTIYQIHNGKIDILQTISNEESTQNITLPHLINNDIYEYYIKVKNIYSNKTDTTDILKVYIDYDYTQINELVKKENNLSSWIFT